MRDLLLQILVYGSLPFAFIRPVWGLFIYAWLSYLRPQDLVWGTGQESSYTQLVAVLMFAGYALQLRRERLPSGRLPVVLLVALCAWITLSMFTAVMPELSGRVWGHYWKSILIAILITAMIRDLPLFRWFLATITLSLGAWGAQYAIYGLRRGGARFDHGPGGMIGDNNSFAVALAMTLPLLLAFALTERRVWMRWAAVVTAALSVVTIFFTFSRSGLLSLIVVSVLMIARARRRGLIAMLVALALGGFLLFSSSRLGSSYLARAGTITNYEGDLSVMGRLDAWSTCWRVFRDYPWLGVGPDNLQAVYFRYSPNSDRFRVAHNSLLQILSESGLPALLLFLATFAVVAWRLERLRRRHPRSAIEVYAGMMQCSLAAYFTGGMFLNMAYLEYVYHLVGLSVSLELAARAEFGREVASEPEAASPDAGWWRRPMAAPG